MRGAGELIKRYREQGEALRQGAEAQALAQLARGEDPEKVLRRFSQQLTNKLMHGPTLRLREASGAERHDVIQAAESLLLDPAAPAQDPE